MLKHQFADVYGINPCPLIPRVTPGRKMENLRFTLTSMVSLALGISKLFPLRILSILLSRLFRPVPYIGCRQLVTHPLPMSAFDAKRYEVFQLTWPTLNGCLHAGLFSEMQFGSTDTVVS